MNPSASRFASSLAASFLLVGCALLAGCAAPADGDATANDDAAGSESDFTSGGEQSATSDIVRLTPLGDAAHRELAPVAGQSSGAGYVGAEFVGKDGKGRACAVRVFHFDPTAKGTDIRIEVRDGDSANAFFLTSNMRTRDLEGYRATASTVQFVDWWVVDQKDRRHDVAITSFDAKGGGITIKMNKLGFDEVTECHDVARTATAVQPTIEYGE